MSLKKLLTEAVGKLQWRIQREFALSQNYFFCLGNSKKTQEKLTKRTPLYKFETLYINPGSALNEVPTPKTLWRTDKNHPVRN